MKPSNDNFKREKYKSWLLESFLVSIWFPPTGLYSLFLSVKAYKKYLSGDIELAMHATILVQRAVMFSVLAGLMVFTAFGIYVYIAGGSFIPIMETFY